MRTPQTHRDLRMTAQPDQHFSGISLTAAPAVGLAPAVRLPDLAAGRVVAFRLPDLADVPAFFVAFRLPDLADVPAFFAPVV
jgi:hypothetical protein